MTTLIPYTTEPNAPFRFTATLDGQPYNVVVTWNLFGARLYANIYAVDGSRVITEPLIGTEPPKNLIDLTWYQGIATAITDRLPYTVGTQVSFTIRDTTPKGFNGEFLCTIDSPTSFTYDLKIDPGPTTFAGVTWDQFTETATILGSYSKRISLVAEYGFSSTLIWSPDFNRFEIDP